MATGDEFRGAYLGHEHTKIAVVATKAFVFGMVRMFQQYVASTAIEFEVFQTREEACQWLGITDLPARPVSEAPPG